MVSEMVSEASHDWRPGSPMMRSRCGAWSVPMVSRSTPLGGALSMRFGSAGGGECRGELWFLGSFEWQPKGVFPGAVHERRCDRDAAGSARGGAHCRPIGITEEPRPARKLCAITAQWSHAAFAE